MDRCAGWIGGEFVPRQIDAVLGLIEANAKLLKNLSGGVSRRGSSRDDMVGRRSLRLHTSRGIQRTGKLPRRRIRFLFLRRLDVPLVGAVAAAEGLHGNPSARGR